MGPTVEVSVVEIFELVWDNKHDALKIQIVFVNVQSEKNHRLGTDKGITH